MDITIARKRLGLILLVMCSLLILTHLLKALFIYRLTVPESLLEPSVAGLVPILAAIAWSTFSDNRFSPCVQVLIVFVTAGGAIFSSYSSFYGVGLYLMGGILLYRYGYLERKFRLKLVLLIAVYVVCTETAAQLQEPESAWIGFDATLYLALYAAFLWIMFERQIRSLLVEKDLLEKELLRGKPYRDLGENVGGLIHNLKNDLSIILSTLTLYEQGQIQSLEPLERGTVRLSERINNITTVIRSRTGSGDTIQDGAGIVKGVLELFNPQTMISPGVDFLVDLPEPLPVYGNGGEIAQVMENIVKNSLEAIRESGQRGTVRVTGGHDGGRSWISIADTAGPMPLCAACSRRDCLYCELIGEGKTSKAEGSGIGLAYVKRVMQRIDGELMIRSGPNGVQTVLVFRQSAPVARTAGGAL